jgi:ribosomal protein S18 acetylase RimI-like enzyme
VTIREARSGDVDAVLAVWALARSAEASTPDDAPAVERALAHRALLVAEVDGAVVGTLIAGWDGWRGNMYRLAVLPGHRRRGIARALVAAGERRLREVGARRITALVGRDDAAATAVWRAAGYAHDPAMARFVRNL